MKYSKKQDNKDTVSYWKSLTDIMSALLLIMLLILMLLILYIVKIPEENLIDTEEGNHYQTEWDGYEVTANQGAEKQATEEKDSAEQELVQNDEGAETEPQTETETEPETEGDIYPDWGADKTAVLVEITDGETGRVIAEAGVGFELYNQANRLQTLHTYYPDEKEYKEYQTRRSGTFFLPEKLRTGEYYLKVKNAPTGYDKSENQPFTIEEPLDWQDALVINVPFYPAKNQIHVEMKDARTGEPVQKGSYQVVAAEDIRTLDGTLRYKENEVVDEIVCGDDGIGSSIDLYLGKYQLRQHVIPDFYAGDTIPTNVILERKDENKKEILCGILCEKTGYSFSITDELYPEIPMADVKVQVIGKKQGSDGASMEEVFTTDAFGQIQLTDLKKDTTYQWKQITTLDGYEIGESNHSFYVSSDGRINGNANEFEEFTNRLIRVTVAIKDKLLNSPASDYNVVLFNDQEEVVHTWVSSGTEEKITGLASGEYYIEINGQKEKRIGLRVLDEKEEQKVTIRRWTKNNLFLMLILIIIIILVTGVMSYIIIKKQITKKRRKDVD